MKNRSMGSAVGTWFGSSLPAFDLNTERKEYTENDNLETRRQLQREVVTFLLETKPSSNPKAHTSPDEARVFLRPAASTKAHPD